MRGIGDRWLAGEAVEGVTFAHGARVTIGSGTNAGRSGTIALLLAVSADPTYIVALDGGGDARVRQSALKAQ